MRAIIIARVSTEKQAGPQRHSLGTQEENGRDVCARQGWEVARVILIPGESAYVDDIARRPEFQEAIAYAERELSPGDVVLFQEMSRAFRSPIVGWPVIHRMRLAGIRLLDFSLTDYTEDEDRATFDMWAARRSSRDHAKRVAIGVDKQFRRGLPTGDIPFGYRRVMTTDARGATVPNTEVPPVPVPEEADAIRWLAHAYLSGTGYLAMVDYLNRLGMRPRSKRRRLAGLVIPPRETFAVTSVQRILENPFYAGWLTHKGERIRGAHEPILSEELFAEMESRRTGARRTVPQTRQLLSGITPCRLCGQPINCQRSSEHYYYRERPRGGEECVNVRGAMRADAVHASVEAVLSAIEPHNDKRFLDYVNARLGRRDRTGVAKTRAAIGVERERVLHLFMRGQISTEEKDRALDDIAARLAALPPDIDDAGFMVQRMRSFTDAWGEADPEDKFEAVRTILRAVPLDVRAREVYFDPWPDYRPLFALRRDFVTGVRPGGVQRRAVTPLFSFGELVA